MKKKNNNDKIVEIMKKLGKGSVKVFLLMAVDTFFKNQKLKFELKVAKITTLVLTAISTSLGIKLHKEHKEDKNLERLKEIISNMSEEELEQLVLKIVSQNEE